jgi:hypothetical protein
MFMSKDGSTKIIYLDMFVIVIFHLKLNVIVIHRLCNSCEITFVSWFMVKHICMFLCNNFCVYYLGWCGNKLKHWRLFACIWSWWWRIFLLWKGPYGLQELERWQSQSCCISVCELNNKKLLATIEVQLQEGLHLHRSSSTWSLKHDHL